MSPKANFGSTAWVTMSHRASTCFGCALCEQKPGTQLRVVGFRPLQKVCHNFLHTSQWGVFKRAVGVRKISWRQNIRPKDINMKHNRSMNINMRLNPRPYKITQIPMQNSSLSFWQAFPNECCIILPKACICWKKKQGKWTIRILRRQWRKCFFTSSYRGEKQVRL